MIDINSCSGTKQNKFYREEERKINIVKHLDGKDKIGTQLFEWNENWLFLY